MITICAWCHVQLGDDGAEDAELSHGICPPCRALVEEEARHDDPRAKELLALLLRLRRALGAHPQTTAGWLDRVLRECVRCEQEGRTHFGGVAPMLWWIIEQCAKGEFRSPLRVNTYLATRC
jgi:hypothetical protein